MLFTSHSFIFLFVPAVLLTTFIVGKLFGRNGAIISVILGSLIFYYLAGRAQLAVLIASLALNYLLISLWFWVSEPRSKRIIIAISVIGNLAALAYYKYAGFLVTQANTLSGAQFAVPAIALPLAISFFTFQQIAYALDVQAGRVKEHRLLDYAFCVTFFPHLVAGPIVNYRELIPQLKANKIFGFRQIDVMVGIAVFLIGLAKKNLIADQLASYAAPGFAAADGGSDISAATAWVSALCYTFQIYFDFSGYSDMAIGLARLFGVHLPVNFASPYKATSIIDFWRRWHITLSRFLRDYLYFSLGGNRKGPWRRHANLALTMLLGGLWHGASWTFVIWGGAHGLLLILNHGWRELSARVGLDWVFRGQAGVLLARAITFFAVVLTWVLFRAETISGARRMFRAMFGLSAPVDFHGDGRLFAILILSALIAFALPNTQEFFVRYRVAIRPDAREIFAKPLIAWRATMLWLVAVATTGGVACFYQAEFPQFLYWGF
jgi:D-alanyl-lipoteichoic acid acyltransferase DltB (MBOAT superfamily)